MASEATPDPLAEPDLEPPASRQRVVILSGLSGGGKTAAAKLIEDAGYTVIDNVPAELLVGLAELASEDHARFSRVAIVLDVRTGDTERAYRAMRGALEGRGIRPLVLFLEARDDALIRRYSETRHRHPLDAGVAGVAGAIAEERRRLAPMRVEADAVIDTSDLSLRELRERVLAALEEVAGEDFLIRLISFGYKFGLPLDADLVFDARLLRNPHYVPELRPQSGLTEAVRSFVLGQPAAAGFVDRMRELLEYAVPAYAGEGRPHLTVAIGCTGGFHRSVVLAEVLGEQLRERDVSQVSVAHRDLQRPVNERG